MIPTETSSRNWNHVVSFILLTDVLVICTKIDSSNKVVDCAEMRKHKKQDHPIIKSQSERQALRLPDIRSTKNSKSVQKDALATNHTTLLLTLWSIQYWLYILILLTQNYTMWKVWFFELNDYYRLQHRYDHNRKDPIFSAFKTGTLTFRH